MTLEEAKAIYNSPAYKYKTDEEKAEIKHVLASNGVTFDGVVTQTPEDMGTTGNLTQEQMRTGRDLGINTDAQGKALDEGSRERIEAGKEIYGSKPSSISEAVKNEGGVVPTAMKGLGNLAGSVTEGSDSATQQPSVSNPSDNVSTPSVSPTSEKDKSTDVGGFMRTNSGRQATAGVRSIMDAYADGSIDKSTRDYLIVDTLANFAKSLGAMAGNIGAAYTGGQMQDVNNESLWSQQQKADLEQQQNIKRESVVGSPEWRKAQSEMEGLTSEQLNNKIKSLQSQYTDEQLRNMLIMQAQQIGMNGIARRIADRKLSISDVFSEMSRDSGSQIGQLGYGLLATMSLDGGMSLMNTASSFVGGMFR